MGDFIIKYSTGHEDFISMSYFNLENYFNKFSGNLSKIVCLDLNLVLDSVSLTQFVFSLKDSSLVDYLINLRILRTWEEWKQDLNVYPTFPDDPDYDPSEDASYDPTHDEFIEFIGEIASNDMQTTGVLASITIAQAILESGWGTSGLTQDANNYFGIKAFASWTGPKVNYPTKEFIDGKYVTVNSYFRAYDSAEESVADHSNLFKNKRYATLLQSMQTEKDYEKAAQLLQECGYATDPNYPSKIINLIETYNLIDYDV